MDLRARIESCFARRKTEDDKFVYVYLPTGEEGVGGRGALEAFANDTAAFETFVTKYKDPLVDFDGFCYEVKGKLFKVKYESGEEPENFEVRNKGYFSCISHHNCQNIFCTYPPFISFSGQFHTRPRPIPHLGEK